MVVDFLVFILFIFFHIKTKKPPFLDGWSGTYVMSWHDYACFLDDVIVIGDYEKCVYEIDTNFFCNPKERKIEYFVPR